MAFSVAGPNVLVSISKHAIGRQGKQADIGRDDREGGFMWGVDVMVVGHVGGCHLSWRASFHDAALQWLRIPSSTPRPPKACKGHKGMDMPCTN